VRKTLFVLSATTTVQLHRRPAIAAVRRTSSPPSRHPLSPIKSSPLVTGEFEKWVSYRVFFSFAFLIRLCCFGVHKFKVQNTPLPCHKEAPLLQLCGLSVNLRH